MLLVGFSSLLMGIGLKVGHFEKNALLASHSDFVANEVPKHWVDYFLMELADTGEELPEKHVEQREGKTGFRKQTAKTKIKPAEQEPCLASCTVDTSPLNTLAANNVVPLHGYYASLHLFHLF